MNKIIALIFSGQWNIVINIALAAVLGHSIVQLSLLASTTHSTINLHQQSHISTIVKTPVPTTLNMTALLKAYLFGTAQIPATQVASQIAKTPPETKLNLKLQGIYYSSNSSFAIIATQKGKSKLYRIGESLSFGSAVLYEIYPKKVILLRNGRYETLHLAGSQGMAHQLKGGYAKSVQESITTSNTMRPEKLLGNYQRQLQTNPGRLMKLAQISPVKQNGRLIGYRIRPRKDATLLSQFNLQSGDILTAINGVELNSPLKGLGVVQQLATTNQVNLQILRNGQVMSFSFAVEK